LLQLTGIPSDERQEGVKVLDDFDIMKESLIFKEEETIGDGAVDIRWLHLRFGLAGKFEEAFDNILAIGWPPERSEPSPPVLKSPSGRSSIIKLE